jgi:hypothetical protein
VVVVAGAATVEEVVVVVGGSTWEAMAFGPSLLSDEEMGWTDLVQWRREDSASLRISRAASSLA